MNAVHLLGRFTRDNDFKEVGETNIFRNNIAVPRNFKNKDGERESDFINVVAFSFADFQFFGIDVKEIFVGHGLLS